MSTEEIAALKIPAADDAVLFQWATVPMMLDALHVIQAWGFQYKSQIVWHKEQLGTGYWVRNCHELLLIATKGNIPAPPPHARPPSVFTAPRGKHSEKPERAYEIIETMYPDLPKLELFARARRPGWEPWGNQLEPAARVSLKRAPINDRRKRELKQENPAR
jgi:N6-adenosine-specific RNA methylase IME4